MAAISATHLCITDAGSTQPWVRAQKQAANAATHLRDVMHLRSHVTNPDRGCRRRNRRFALRRAVAWRCDDTCICVSQMDGGAQMRGIARSYASAARRHGSA
jgi:hypothetical protein